MVNVPTEQPNSSTVLPLMGPSRSNVFFLMEMGSERRSVANVTWASASYVFLRAFGL